MSDTVPTEAEITLFNEAKESLMRVVVLMLHHEQFSNARSIIMQIEQLSACKKELIKFGQNKVNAKK